jgi:RNA 3'-phosphate cyclase
MITIDGSVGEGGGQMLRTAVGLSALIGKSVEITNIRAKRPNPGLAAQHLAAVRCVARLCNAEVEGANPGSTTLRFSPGQISGGKFEIDIGTAGSLTLVLQAALLPAAFAAKPVVLKLTGGTDVSWSPPMDYLKEVFLPAIRQFCPQITVNVMRRGYYPAGGGEIDVRITPALPRSTEPDWARFAPIVAAKVPNIDLMRRGRLVCIKGVAHASTSLAPKKVAESIAESARLALSRSQTQVDIAAQYSPAQNAGAGITLWAIFSDSGEINDDSIRIGSSSLLGKMTTPEGVGEDAATQLMQHMNSDRAIDPYLADQLIPWLALAGSGSISSTMTDHVKTNIQVVEQMLGKKFLMENGIVRRV